MTLKKKDHLFTFDREKIIQEIGRDKLLTQLKKMLLIRNLEIRGEAAYQQGKVGGFFHSYIGQEAIQVGCVAAAGDKHWYTTTYRCHALAFLLGATPREIMAELYGKEGGIAKGRGGSMHFFTDRMLGGLAIVGGHVPIATGAGFSIQYLDQKDLVSFCFLGEGAVAQGAVHESLNLASLWNLPVIYVIENNQWGMGTSVERAIAVQPIAEHYASSYGMSSYAVDGMDFFATYALFQKVLKEVLQSSRPLLIEAFTERFRGHSISDPGSYRSREHLTDIMSRDPINLLKSALIENKMINEKQYEEMDREQKEIVLEAMKWADDSPWPKAIDLEEDVFK